MKCIATPIPEVLLIQPKCLGDGRGFFMEAYQAHDFASKGIPTSFVQDNHSGSRQGVLRGLHYQIRRPQGKLIRVVAGEVYDVAVDVRWSSPTFGKWVGVKLSAQNRLQLWVPAGFAHGFYVLSAWAEIVYKVTDFYDPQWEQTLAWNDPALNIFWPLLNGQPPVLSAKDGQGKRLCEAELFDYQSEVRSCAA